MISFLLFLIIILLAVVICVVVFDIDFGFGAPRANPSPNTTFGMAFPENIARLFPQWVVAGTLGEGGVGSVFRVWDASLGQYLAVKVLREVYCNHAQMRLRFMDEAELLARCAQTGCAPTVYYKCGETDERLWYAMELLDGYATLEQWVESGCPAPTRVMIAKKMAEAVALMHDARVLHRDLCPNNILADFRRGMTTPVVKLIDFGSATMANRADSGIKMLHHATQVGWFAGKHSYSAPEVIKHGMNKADASTDAFSLGVIIFNLLTRTYLQGDSMGVIELSAGQLREAENQLVRAGGISPGAAGIIVAALKTKEKRPTAREIASAL